MEEFSLFFVVVAMAFLCEYLDILVGIGYGTLLSPLLLIIGFSPLQAIPAILISQTFGGMLGGFIHHRVGNIYLDFSRDDVLIKERLRWLGYIPKSKDAKIVFILVICGITGSLSGVLSAINIPLSILGMYIGVMVLAIGTGIVMKRDRKSKLSWKGLIAIGLIGSFNKGISGGGGTVR